jgi:hypothetical protein
MTATGSSITTTTTSSTTSSSDDILLSRHSSVGIATRLRGGQCEVRNPAQAKIYFSKMSRPVMRNSQPPAQWIPSLVTGVKQPGRDFNPQPRLSTPKFLPLLYAFTAWTGTSPLKTLCP